MTNKTLLRAGLLAGSVLLTTLGGCMTAGSGRSAHYPTRPAVQASLMVEDDYDYYPRYEIYYSRHRNEYIYRDASAWVRRSDLQGITLAMLESGPVVRMDFHDSPEFHHSGIVQRFPRNWEQPGRNHNDKNRHRDDERDEKRGKQKDDDKRSDQRSN